MAERFDGKVALVTGAGSGIGSAAAALLSDAGARVWGADLAAPARDGVRGVALDVRSEEAWEEALGALLAAEGRLDVLVNCAGISAASPIADTPFDEWRRVLATNLDGAFLATRHGVRAMRERGGAIVHVGSASGIRAAAGAAAYSASKAGLAMLARAAAKECREAKIPVRINVVSPAGVKTPMWRAMPFFRELVRTAGSEEGAYAAMAASGGGPFAEPEEVARVILFLASDAARHVTGAELPVDSGYVL